VPTHYTIGTYGYGPGGAHLKSWLVETSVDGENWREVDQRGGRWFGNKQLNGERFTATFPVADGGECRFIRLVNIGRNHSWSDLLWISAWEIFGRLIERTADSSDVAFGFRPRAEQESPVDGPRPSHTWRDHFPCFGGTMGTQTDSTVPSCRLRLQRSAFAWFLRCNRCIGPDTPTES
jgi:hypothetical protein